MSAPKVFVLPTPWALFDPEADKAGYGRLPLKPDVPVSVSAGRPIYLAAAVNLSIRISGYKMAVHRIGGYYRLGDDEYALYLLSVGVRASEDNLEIEANGEWIGTISVDGYIPRPAFSAGQYNSEVPEGRAETLDRFLLSLVDLIQMTFDPQYETHQIMWDRLQIAWTDQDAESTTPPMSLIVRHAEKYGSLVRDLVERPRHLLRRQRELTPIDRVQQLDVSCIRWLSRQSGHTVYERAGPKQKIMAVQRHESLDTLENRVLRDFSLRTSREATRYSNNHYRLKTSNRWNLVHQYGRRCHRSIRELTERGVAEAHAPVVPNFVLLQDVRYRHLWRAYLEIIRRQDEEDECWRWQHNLWQDFCRFLTHLSLRQSEEFSRIAEAPLRVSMEQVRGVWGQISSQSGTWLISDGVDETYVVSLIWSTDIKHPKTEHWMTGLGCDTYLYVQRLSDNADGFISIWGYHGFSSKPELLEDLAASCDRALKRVQDNEKLQRDMDLHLRGIILVSNAFHDTTRHGVLPERSLKKLHGGDAVSVDRVGAKRSDIDSAINRLSESIAWHVTKLFGGR